MSMMRTGILALVGAMVLVTQVFAGNWTGNGFIYKPALGARGAQDKSNFDSGQDRVDARLGKEIWVGDPKYGTTPQDAITAIGSNHATLRVPAGTCTISANLIIPVNVTLRVERGATLAIATGKFLTINGGLEAGLYQVFSGAGSVVFGAGSNPEIKPEWWGAKGDDSTDCTAALQAAINTAYYRTGGVTSANAGTLVLSNGTYRVTATAGNHALAVSCNIKGQSPNTSIIKNVGTGSAILIRNGIYYTRWENFSVVGNASSQDGIVTATTSITTSAYSAFQNVDVTYHGRHGLVLRNTHANRFIDCKFSYNEGLGVYIQYEAGDPSIANATSFINCEARWNGGPGDAGADYTKGGVRIDGANSLLWLGGVVESNNAWGFIIGEGVGALSYAINISGVYFEDTPRSSSSSTVGGLIRANGRWNNLTIENCWGSYGGKAGVTAYGLYVTNTLLRDTYAPYLAPSFVDRNNWFTRGAYGTNIRKFVGATILNQHGLTKENLLANSGFGSWSNSTLENIGSVVSVTGITAGVCAATNTQGIGVGKLVQFGAGGSTANKVYEVTAVTVNTSFTLHDTSITDATPVICYEATPGCVAADDWGPDGWQKSYSASRPSLYREFSGSNTKGFYALKVVATETAQSHGVYQHLNKTDSATSPNAFQHLRGRTVTIGCWVKADTVGVAELQIYDRVANPIAGMLTVSSANLTTDWEWIEVTRTFPDAALDRAKILLAVKTTGHTVYFSQPMLTYGDAIGVGNYMQPNGEMVYLESPVTLTNFNSTTVTTNRVINLEAESKGKLPKGLKAAEARVTVNQSAITNGDSLWIKPTSAVASGLRVSPQVANTSLYQNGWVMTDGNGDLYAQYGVSGGSFTSTVTVNALQLR